MTTMDAALLSLARTAAEHWPATLAVAGAAWAAWKAARFAKSDADAGTLRALHAMPADAFAGKVVLLVGASSGIGEALALALAARGATLILCARRVDRLVDVARRCMEAGAPDAVAQKLDVTDFDSHKATVDSLVRRFGRVDVLVNNAGASQRALASETPLSVDREMFTLNVFGVMNVTRAVLPHMLAAGRGHIVTTSSVAGKTGSPISASYAATKHALQGWFDSLRMEVRARKRGAACGRHQCVGGDWHLCEHTAVGAQTRQPPLPPLLHPPTPAQVGYRGIDVTNVCPGPVISEITQHAFTAQPGKRLGEPVKDAEHRLTAGA
jgi:short-subunit dehydrogenase